MASRPRSASCWGLLAITAAAAPASKETPQQFKSQWEEKQWHDRLVKNWQYTISQTPPVPQLPYKAGDATQPGVGCFKAKYPSKVWATAACDTKMANSNTAWWTYYSPPSANTPNSNVTDISATASSPAIFSVIGSFDSITPDNVKVTGVQNGSTTGDRFSLQINSQPFFPTTTKLCGANPCGWQQFIYSGTQCAHPCIFIKSWLIGTSALPGTDPNNWQANSPTQLFLNSPSMTVPLVTSAQLKGVTLTGTAAGGTAGKDGMDTVVLTTADGHAYALVVNTNAHMLGLAGQWDTAEFNVFGDCCGSEATFSAGAAVVTRTRVVPISGSKIVVTCLEKGFTSETNNLGFALLQPSPLGGRPGGPGPAVVATTDLANPSPKNNGPLPVCKTNAGTVP